MYGQQGGKRVGGVGMNYKVGTDICSPLCIKWIANDNENLRYSTGNSAQCSGVT